MDKFIIIETIPVSPTRKIVISKNLEIEGAFTIGQKIIVDESAPQGMQKQTSVFLKGALHIDSLEALYELRDAINRAIEKVESELDKAKIEQW